jgi:hypothetical protein
MKTHVIVTVFKSTGKWSASFEDESLHEVFENTLIQKDLESHFGFLKNKNYVMTLTGIKKEMFNERLILNGN